MEESLRASTLSKQHKNVIHRSVRRWDTQITSELAKESDVFDKIAAAGKKK